MRMKAERVTVEVKRIWGDEITLSLPREVAQQLCDILSRGLEGYGDDEDTNEDEDDFGDDNDDMGDDMEGNDMEDVMNKLQEAKTISGQGIPVCILMKTEMGQGVDYMIGSHKWHGIFPNAEQTADALAQLEETLGDY